MRETLDSIDNRPSAQADNFAYAPLDLGDARAAWLGLSPVWHSDIEETRVTVISPEHPHPSLAEGYYFEGWTVAPHRMDPPHKAGPFYFPTTPTAGGDHGA